MVVIDAYAHVGTEVEAIKNLKTKGDLAPKVVKKILEESPAALYALWCTVL